MTLVKLFCYPWMNLAAIEHPWPTMVRIESIGAVLCVTFVKGYSIGIFVLQRGIITFLVTTCQVAPRPVNLSIGSRQVS